MGHRVTLATMHEPAPAAGPQATSLGKTLRQIKLKGLPPLPSRAEAPATLTLTTTGLWLVSSAATTPPLTVAVLQQSPLRYRDRMLGDRLVIGAREFVIPTGSGAAVREMIALARLRAADDGRDQRHEAALAEQLRSCPWVDKTDACARSWLAHWLTPGERVLAWLDSSSDVDIVSPHGSKYTCSLRWLLTDKRAALVAIGPFGDVHLVVLPKLALKVASGLGRCAIRADEHHWLSTLTNAGDYRALAAAAGASQLARRREVARVSWRSSRGKSDAAEWARKLLLLSRQRDPWAALSLAMLDGDVQTGVDAAIAGGRSLRQLLQALAQLPGSAAALAPWADGWGWSPALVQALAQRCAEVEQYQCAAALHQYHWSATRADTKHPVAIAQRDHQLAVTMMAAGHRARAAELLTVALALLPSPDVLELVPHVDAAEEGGVLHMRLQLLDTMVEVLGAPEVPHLPSLLAIAQLFPLHRERVAALAKASDGDLQRRAQQLLACLQPGGLEASATTPFVPCTEDGNAQLWSHQQVEELLRHPAARAGGALGKLQALLAQVDVPDHSALKSYCQHLDQHRVPYAHAALTCAGAALSAPPLEAYVSQGDKSVGIRAFEGNEPFLLIGGDHLVADSRFYLSPQEMAFAIATEVAHVRFGHARVTSSDLWRGAFEKGKTTVNLALGVMPALKAFRFGTKLATIAEHMSSAPLGMVLGAAARWWSGSSQEAVDPSLHSGHEQLLVAHRVTQFTADRAGLLIAGALRPSLRAMFLTSSRYQPQLATAKQQGLTTLLLQTTPEGTLRFAELAARVGALASFILSDEYVTLRDELQHDP